MRCLLMGLVLAGTTFVPMLAWGGTQEQKTAEQIAASLRNIGKPGEFRIVVKYQDGTAWLAGRVRTEEQMNKALSAVFDVPGVHRVVNNLAVSRSETAAALPAAPVAAKKAGNPASSTIQETSASRIATRAKPAAGPALQASATESATPPQVLPQVQKAPLPRLALLQAPAVPPAPAPAAPAAPATPPAAGVQGPPLPMYSSSGVGPAPARYDQPNLPNYAWPSYASYPNYAAVTYPKQYSPTAWPYIGPFYPYPQVPLGWRKVTLQWDDGWWMLDFKDEPSCCWWR